MKKDLKPYVDDVSLALDALEAGHFNEADRAFVALAMASALSAGYTVGQAVGKAAAQSKSRTPLALLQNALSIVTLQKGFLALIPARPVLVPPLPPAA